MYKTCYIILKLAFRKFDILTGLYKQEGYMQEQDKIQNMTHEDVINLLKKGENKSKSDLSITQKFNISYPYLTTFLVFIMLYISMSIMIGLLLGLALRFDLPPIIALIINFIGAFFIFRGVIKTTLLPYVK